MSSKTSIGAVAALILASTTARAEAVNLPGPVPPQLRLRLGGTVGYTYPGRTMGEVGLTFDAKLDTRLALTLDVAAGFWETGGALAPFAGVRGFFLTRPNGLFAYWFAMGGAHFNLPRLAYPDVALGLKGGAGLGYYVTPRIGFGLEAAVDLGVEFVPGAEMLPPPSLNHA